MEEQPDFNDVVGQSYGLAEAQMGRELYEANITGAAGVAGYWQAKAKFWNVLGNAVAVLTLLGLMAGVTGLVKWWVS